MLTKFKGIDKSELSMVEVAHAILEEKNDIIEFNELLVLVQEFLDLSEEELDKRMSIFYTELNTDGSFISLGDNRWGLRAWYPIDSIDEELVSALEDATTPRRKKRKKVNAFAISEDDVDYNDDDPEDMDDLDDMDDVDELDVELTEYDTDINEDDDVDTSIEEDLTVVSDEELFDEEM